MAALCKERGSGIY